MIREGRVHVNGDLVTELGTKVDPAQDTVSVNGETVDSKPDYVYIALFKPRGVITSLSDPQDRQVVVDFLPKNFPRVWPVGRLDWDSEGLVLLTNDGDLTHALTHPSKNVEKGYVVKLRGRLNHADPGLARMRSGITLDDGFVTSPAEVIVESHADQNTWVHVVIREGHNRQIRKMAEAVGHRVQRLKRIFIGPVPLEPLTHGAFRFLDPSEVRALYDASGAKMGEHAKRYKSTRATEVLIERPRQAREKQEEAEAKRDKRDKRDKQDKEPSRKPKKHKRAPTTKAKKSDDGQNKEKRNKERQRTKNKARREDQLGQAPARKKTVRGGQGRSQDKRRSPGKGRKK